MKTGYSLLLGEYVDAQKVNYVDCKQFQIVCPICKEPIFKVNRELTSTPIEYLSHYQKDKAYIAECELRVRSLSKEEIAKSNSVSRDQRLEYFLGVLKKRSPTRCTHKTKLHRPKLISCFTGLANRNRSGTIAN